MVTLTCGITLSRGTDNNAKCHTRDLTRDIFKFCFKKKNKNNLKKIKKITD